MFVSQTIIKNQTNQQIFYSFLIIWKMLHVPHDCVQINQKLLFKGIGVGGITLPHELRLISFNAWEMFIFFQIYTFTILITNVLCLLIVNKTA